MAEVKHVRGACNCGRNHYTVVLPVDAIEQATIYFDDSRAARRSQAAPITAWLRVPLTWYSSMTTAQLSDETHSSIRRTFASPHEPSSKRIFCGYCGTHLSYWTEEPASEADYLSVTLGSLSSQGIGVLQDLDVISDEVGDAFEIEGEQGGDDEDEAMEGMGENGGAVVRTEKRSITGDMSWFEEMIDGSRLGRTHRTRRGQGVSADGSTMVTYEISEYAEGEEENEQPSATTTTRGKRKLSDVVNHDDTTGR